MYSILKPITLRSTEFRSILLCPRITQIAIASHLVFSNTITQKLICQESAGTEQIRPKPTNAGGKGTAKPASRFPPHSILYFPRVTHKKPAVGGTKPENQRIVKTTTTVKTNAKHTKKLEGSHTQLYIGL